MKRLRFRPELVLLLSIFCAVRESSAGDSSLLAGAAAVDISPETLPAIQNGGFLQNSANQILDRLHARSLVLDDGNETIAIVIVDSCMFPTKLCDEIKRLASKQTGIAANRILISATHTHSAPSTMDMCLGTSADNAYLRFVPARVAQAIADAHRNLQPAKVGWTIVEAADLTNCRRWITRSDRMGIDPFGNQTVRAMMHPGYQNPNYTSPAGPIDPWLSILSVVSAKDESPICAMANLSMHYFGGGAFSADYFGEVARLMEARIAATSGRESPDFVGIMSQGTSGDLHWMDYSKPRHGISRQQYSERVADRVLQAWPSIRHQADLSIAMSEERLTIDRRAPSEERLKWAQPINAARGDRPPQSQVEVYAQQAEWIHQNPHAEVVLQAVRIGELGMTALPNEVYGLTGLKLKRQSPLAATFNLELANGATGYIPPPEQHWLGGYTTWPARTAGLDEQAEPKIVETLLTLLESVSQQKRRSIAAPVSPYSGAVVSKTPLAYWQLDDMVSARVADSVGGHHAKYRGGVALFLPGVDGAGFVETLQDEPDSYGNRAVHLAGGNIAAELSSPLSEYAVSMWIRNSLPADARDVTGVLLSTGAESLSISGSAAGDDAGRLLLLSDTASHVGKLPLSLNHWHQITLVRSAKRVRVYLDGRSKPDIDVVCELAMPLERLVVGSDEHSDNTFDGKVDELAVFDRPLSVDDVVELYDVSGVSPPPEPKTIVRLGAKPADAESRKRYRNAVLASKPVAFLRLHDESTVSAANETSQRSGTYEDGSLPFTADTETKNFDGGRVKAQIQGLGSTYSVEFWFRNELPVHSRPVTAYIFSRAIDGIHGAPGDNIGLGGTHSNAGRLIVFNGNDRNQLLAGRTRIPVGSWAHVVMVRQDQRVTVYLNGDPLPEIADALPVGYPAMCDSILLGGRADNFANLQGMMEEIAIYDRAVSAEEVGLHFKAAGVEQIMNPNSVEATSVDRPSPTEAAVAINTIHVPNGFEVQLMAAEPLVLDPVAIDWGADGRLWVVEMADYPLGIDGRGKSGGRVRILEDTNEDGEYDRSTLFAEGLSYPTGILVWGRGVLVTAAPQIVYLEDSTGDGQADVRRVLFSGFMEGNQQLRVNGLRRGLDNWVYCASGSHHGGYGKDSWITSHLTGEQHQIGSRDFRIRPDTGALDPQSGPSQFGRNRDDWGNWFGVQNSLPLWHYVLTDHHIRRNPHFAPPDPKHQVVTPVNPRVYPASKRQKRYHNFSQSGRFTSACSAMIYRDDVLFNRRSEQHAFTCEPFHNLVQHNLIADDGVSFKFRRDPAEKLDFFASEDRWCRPVMARTGPDGALWVVDMYRYMIEHPEWLPQDAKDELRPWYRSGENRGRIYRVVRSSSPARRAHGLRSLSTPDLVATLESSNGWQRDTAQQILVTEHRRDATELLIGLTARSRSPLARLHALWTLNGLDALPTTTLEAALDDPNAGVRRNAVRIATAHRVDSRRLAAMVGDRDAKVRLELATTLGEYDDDEAAEALGVLAVSCEGDLYQLAAVMSSLNPRNVVAATDVVINSTEAGADVTLEMIRVAVAMSDTTSIGHVIGSVAGRPPEAATRYEHLAAILDGLQTRGLPADALLPSVVNQVAAIISEARSVAANVQVAADVRCAAVSLLGREQRHTTTDFELFEQLLVPQSTPGLQQAVVTRLAGINDPLVADLLLKGWTSHSPQLKRQILDVLASRRSWAESLQKCLEDGAIRPGELSADLKQRLLERSENAPRWRNAVAIDETGDRFEALREFEKALTLAGDSRRGAKLFRKVCLNCHQLQGEGYEVGPQLWSITHKSPEALLSSILDPNAAVDAKYFSYTIVVNDGRTHSGLLETETGSSITLLAAGRKRTTILRRDIDILQSDNRSLMPDGLENELSPQDVADLIQFIRDHFKR